MDVVSVSFSCFSQLKGFVMFECIKIKRFIGPTATVLAVAGVILNNYHIRWCFIAWIISNILCLRLHAAAHLSGTADMKWLIARDIIFTLLSAHGFYMWS